MLSLESESITRVKRPYQGQLMIPESGGITKVRWCQQSQVVSLESGSVTSKFKGCYQSQEVFLESVGTVLATPSDKTRVEWYYQNNQVTLRVR